jgi:hypothetical protein
VAVLESIQGDAPDRADGFELAYVTRDGAQARVALADAGSLPLERAAPVRRFASYKGQRHLPGRWWSATDQRHVGYESWLERDHLAAFDFDPAVVAIASQPFWLLWTAGEGKARSHAPDFFLRRGNGSAVVVDCRPAERRRPAGPPPTPPSTTRSTWPNCWATSGKRARTIRPPRWRRPAGSGSSSSSKALRMSSVSDARPTAPRPRHGAGKTWTYGLFPDCGDREATLPVGLLPTAEFAS